MDQLLDLFLLERIVAAGSFTAASRRTGLSKSRLSRRIAALEDRLGVGLIHRNSRQVVPTTIGDVVIRYVRRMIAEAEGAERAAREHAFDVSGNLRISIAPLLDDDFLGQILSDFAQMHPRVEISLEMTCRVANLIAERTDIALRLSNALRDPSELVVRKLSVISMRLVAAPGLLAAEGAPGSAEDLAEATWLMPGSLEGTEGWGLKTPSGLPVSVTPRSRIVVNNDGILRKLALDGRGIARLPHFLCEEDLLAGRLVPVLPDWRPAPRILYVAYPSRHGLSRASRSFIDFLAARMPPQIEGVFALLPAERAGVG